MDTNVLVALAIVALIAFGAGHNTGKSYPSRSHASAVGERIPFTQADVNLLARLIDAEARGEPYKGKVAVGAVVVNRIRDPRFPNTLRGVVFQPHQFYTRAVQGRGHPSTESLRAAREALNGSDPSKGALFFYNPKTAQANAWWRERPVTRRIGGHTFTR